MEAELPPNLENIVGEYCDIDTYKILILYNPSIHTDSKLRLKCISNISLPNIELLSKAYQYAKDWSRYSDGEEYFGGVTEPILFLPNFIDIVRLYGDIDIETFRKSIIFINNEGNTVRTRFSNILDGKLSATNKIIDSIKLNNIADEMSGEQKQILSNYYDIKEIDEDAILCFSNYFIRQIYVLMKKDPEFHPMSNIKKYQKKLIEMVFTNEYRNPVQTDLILDEFILCLEKTDNELDVITLEDLYAYLKWLEHELTIVHLRNYLEKSRFDTVFDSEQNKLRCYKIKLNDK